MNPIDHQRVLAEIDAEVRRKRESGELPADLERELDLVFARYAPVHVLDADYEQVIERAQQLTFIDPIAPVESSRPGVAQVKRVLRKAVLWMLRHITQQVTGMAEVLTRAVRLLGLRVDALEQVLPAVMPPVPGMAPAALPDGGHWTTRVPELMGGVRGRVLLADVENPTLLPALLAAGIDAYGVDPNPASTADGEVRTEDISEHVGKLADGALGGLVLVGLPDRLSVGGKVNLLSGLLPKLAPGARVVIVGTNPRWWGWKVGPVRADLAPGRPLDPETWRHLLTDRGCTVDAVETGPRAGGLQPVATADASLAANLERIDEALFPPASFAIVATVALT